MTTVTREIHFARKTRCKIIEPGPPPEPRIPAGRIPRVSKLMALAIRFDQMLANGRVASMSELARLAHVTQPRMTQIMNLNHLAPDIQEQLLFLPKVTVGREQIHERILRRLVAIPDFTEQRRYWAASCPTDHLPQGSARSLPSQVVKEL